MGNHTLGCGKRNGWGTVDWGVADATGREAMGGGL
jgi:hypothetical protein